MGSKFLLKTDHYALQWLSKVKDTTKKLTRWSLKLSEFDMEVKYVPGKSIPHVDALSRLSVNSVEGMSLIQAIHEAQARDSSLDELRFRAQNSQNLKNPFLLEEGFGHLLTRREDKLLGNN